MRTDASRAACAAVRAMNEEDREETNRARAELGVEPLPKGGYRIRGPNPFGAFWPSLPGRLGGSCNLREDARFYSTPSAFQKAASAMIRVP